MRRSRRKLLRKGHPKPRKRKPLPIVSHAFWSDKVARRDGYSVYLSPDGQEINTTGVFSTKKGGELARWSDKVYVGPVVKYVRSVGKCRDYLANLYC